jgi:hypothetical protein
MPPFTHRDIQPSVCLRVQVPRRSTDTAELVQALFAGCEGYVSSEVPLDGACWRFTFATTEDAAGAAQLARREDGTMRFLVGCVPARARLRAKKI